MQFVDSPDLVLLQSKEIRVFFAGGITDCPDWQKELKGLLKAPAIVFNPRRANFPMDDPNAAQTQITWERLYLDSADIVSFWFAAETIQPIVLLEFGRFIDTKKHIVVGVHPEYSRRQDVEIQLFLARPGAKTVNSLESLGKAIDIAVKDLILVKSDGIY